MDGIDHEVKDPFLWDVGAVSNSLCLPGRPWARDPVGLAQKISEEEIDGKTLLTYEHTFSRKELMKCLGVKTAGQMAALAEEIIGLQSRSKGFRTWKINYLPKISSHDLFDDEPLGGAAILGTSSKIPGMIDQVQSASTSTKHRAIEDGSVMTDQTAEQPLTPATSNFVLALEPSGEEENGFRDVEDLTQNNQERIPSSVLPSDHEDGQNRDERPLKRRRIEPINLSLQPLADQSVVAPEFRIPDPSREAPSENNLDAYLGSNVLNELALKSHVGPVDPRVIELPNSSFATATSIFLPPGQRIWVAGLMKTLLTKNSRRERLLRQGLSPSAHSSGDEDILDMSDLAEEWDEETQREIDEEKAESAARERELARYLSQERVEAILLESLDMMKVKWEEKKLPKYESKAYGLWMDAARRGRSLKIVSAQQDANRCEARIQNMMTEILNDKWQREQDVRDQARIMEQNVDEKLYSMWLVTLLASRKQPEKPIRVPRLRESKPRPSLLDDEVLTSDDDMDDFIVQNEEQPDQAMNTKVDHLEGSQPRTPVVEVDEDIILLDLTQMETSKQAFNSRTIAEYIDLTTPQKTEVATPQKPDTQLNANEMLDSQPPVDELKNIETIASYVADHWAKQKDRWRLIIRMVFRLGHSRRQSIFRLLLDNSMEEAWEQSIQLQLTEPLKEVSQLKEAEAGRLLAFDVTRVFYSFLRCRHTREAPIAEMEKKMRSRLKSSKDVLFPTFYSFLKEMAPHFPQDHQIFRADAFDDIELDEIPGDEGTSKGPRRAVKEVVQNKDALDMREREVRRIEEQEARRIKLRAEMAKSTAISSDKSRLIINESKQEGQEFIYFNEKIGKRIKDHQINGVRFLWNQLIRDADSRQGCLLAHTMGLGKTMQAITFLVAIAEAAASDKESVRTQIPDDLSKSQTLILCPSGLVDNWVDEVLKWAPDGLLGSIRKIEASLSPTHRSTMVRDWTEMGGLLIIGYDMFRGFCDSDESDVGTLLLDSANLVITDEAHYLKNSTSKLHQVCAKFRTPSRIALTGTPLANNVGEYYSMINWVAPNFLGPLKEFRETYAIPIEQGLESGSQPAEKREALKMMEVLKRTVAPKVHRATISCMESDLPPKFEFVLFVAPTPLQRKLYDLYLEGTQQGDVSRAKIFSILNKLTVIGNHPRCFHAEIQKTRKNPEAMGELLKEDVLDAILKETNAHDMDDPRLSQKVELLMLILDEAREGNEKVLIFSQSLSTLDYLENLFQMQKRRVSRLDGSTKISSRQENIKSFNQGDKEVYLISTKAGGVGLNIQGANRIVIFDLKWNPVHVQQAVGRAYRIGQRRTVYVYHFLLAGSFEQELHNTSVFKMQLASRAVDKKFPVSWGQRKGILRPIQAAPSSDLSPFLNRDLILDKLIGNKPHGEGIKQILSTDTFEEEDPSSKVTPEMNGEVEEFLQREHLRRTDPEKYERFRAEKQMADLASHNVGCDFRHYAGPGRPCNANNHYNSFSNVSQSFDGASDDRSAPNPQPRPGPASSVHVPPPSHHIPVPPPITGANTYFREAELKPSTAPPVAPSGVPSAPRIPILRFEPGGEAGPMFGWRDIFAPPQNQAKKLFETKLVGMWQRARGTSMARLAEEGNTAESIIMAIDNLLKEQAHGFLHDNARWGLLSKHLDNEQFFSAIFSGLLRPPVLALAKIDEIERKVSMLNSLSEQDLKDRYKRKNAPDPSNLGNIKKVNVSSAHAMEDLNVMRITADKRKQRGIRLPTWANEALELEGPARG